MDATKHIRKNLNFFLASELLIAALKVVARGVFVIAMGKE